MGGGRRLGRRLAAEEALTAIRSATLIGGERVPVLGLGTWRMGEDRSKRRGEVAALRLGIELGMTAIDTAEMYGDGGAEEVVGEAIRGRRDDVFVISKFYPHNATARKMVSACERSLRRLGTDRIDLYLLHWRGDVPLHGTLEGFDLLLRAEKIRYAGVSNFGVEDMEELMGLKRGGTVVANEVLFNLVRRGIESDLLPWSRRRKRAIIAYSPIEEGLLASKTHVPLAEIAERHDATPAQIALAWVLRHEGVIAIPKSSSAAHIREDRLAADIHLTQRDLDELDQAFPPPGATIPLQTR